MKNFILFLFVLIIMQPSCHRHAIERLTKAAERVDVEVNWKGYALIRTIFCDVYIEPINYEKWKKILKSKPYKQKGGLGYTVPPLVFFHLIIRNTTDQPVLLEKVQLEYDNKYLTMLSLDDIKAISDLPIYSQFNFKKLFSYRRLIEEKYNIEKIDYNKDTIGYNLNYITPTDTVLRIAAFEWLPVEYKKYKLVLYVKSSGHSRSLNFDIEKYEYRTNGKYFTKPEIEVDEY